MVYSCLDISILYLVHIWSKPQDTYRKEKGVFSVSIQTTVLVTYVLVDVSSLYPLLQR